MTLRPAEPSEHAHPLSLACPAKVNLALSVASPRPSDGLHPIASWMVALHFADTLTLSVAPSGQTSFDIHYQADAPVAETVNWPLEKDLAWRAHHLLQQHTGKPLPITATLAKRIPTGAGLGGGSSDAAGMLVGLDHLFGLNIPTDQLLELASRLGSDVPFLTAVMLNQTTAALITGIGHNIAPLSLLAPIHLVLIFPLASCPTGPVYHAFDQQLGGQTKPADPQRIIDLAKHSLTPDALFNDLALPACQVAPTLQPLMRKASTLLGQPVHLTGSGATLFVLASSAQNAQAMAKQVTTQLGLPALATFSR